MKECFNCHEITVDPEDPPCYDVLNPTNIANTDPSTIGPYCSTCFPNTITGQAILASE